MRGCAVAGRRKEIAVTSSRPGRRELLVVLLVAAAGAAAVLLAMRQGWAHVSIGVPKPLPAGVTAVTGANLVPAASPLAGAALAGLAAVLATRRVLRRIAGIVLVAFGIGIAAAVSASISAADMLAAAAGSAGPGTGAGAGSLPGSATAGGTQGAGVAPVAGFTGHATLAAMPWRGVALAGALLVIAAGAVVIWRADRLPVMSSRYDSPAGRYDSRPVEGQAAASQPDEAAAAAGPGAGVPGGDSAAIWESLSRGEDPTAAGPERHPAS